MLKICHFSIELLSILSTFEFGILIVQWILYVAVFIVQMEVENKSIEVFVKSLTLPGVEGGFQRPPPLLDKVEYL